MTEAITTKPGDKYRSIKNPATYEALRREGYDKTSAARISNAQKRRKRIARKEDPKAIVQRLWASGVKPDDIIGIWYSPSDGTWFVSGGDWAAPGTDEKVKAVFGPGVEWVDEGVPDQQSEESKFTQRLKSYTLDDLERVALKEADPIRAAVIATQLDQATLKGEQLAPGVTRIHGDLCNVHGRWGSCSGAGFGRGESPVKGYKPLPKGPKARAARGRKGGGKGRATAKPKQTPEQRQAATAAAHQQKLADARKKVIDAMAQSDQGLAPNIAKAMLDFADGKPLDGAIAKGLAGVGLVETGPDGQPRLSQAGRMAADAMNRGDVRGALDAISRGASRAEAAAKRTQASVDRETARMQREIEKRNKKGGGHGGKGRKPVQPKVTAPRTPTAARAPAMPKAPKAGGSKPAKAQQQIAPELLNAIQALSEGKPIDQATIDALVRNGLARIVKGQLVLTAAGLRAMRTKAMDDTGNMARWNGTTWTVLKDAGSPGDYLVVEDPKQSSKWHLQVKKNGTPDHRLMGAAWAALHGGYRGNEYTGPNKSEAISKLRALYASEKMPLPSEKSFAVFKDASGNWRWLARTTTAFEDRDQEVISTKALEADVARADADGRYGPLRWWHMGKPNALDAATPWGPGVDLGWCDFNAVSGKTLIESGMFKSEAIAQAVAANADKLELSPGFFHAAGEPDASGVFHHIRRFERSLVPSWAGRASNPYTGLVVEKTMDPKKIEALKTLGMPEATIKELLTDVEQSEKSAEAEGVRYKEAAPLFDWFKALIRGEQPEVATKEEPKPAERTADLHPDAVTETDATPAVVTSDVLTALKEELASLRAEVAALKAPPPPPGGMDAEDDPAMGGDAGADEPAEGEPPVEDGGVDESQRTLTQADGEFFMALLQPLIEAMGITQKLDGHMGELKALMGGFVKQKDDEAAQQRTAEEARQQEIATLKARLDELTGDQPRAGYRPTQAADNSPWADPQVLAAIKGADHSGNGFEDLTSKLFPGILPSN